MKTTAPFDATFAREMDEHQAWLYQDTSVHSACLAWALLYNFNLVEFDDYLQEDGWDSPLAKANQAMLIQRRAQALQARKDGNQELAFAWLNFLKAARLAGKRMAFLIPMAKLGEKFSAGRKAGSIGSVRAFIRQQFRHHPKAKAGEILSALKTANIKGVRVFEGVEGVVVSQDGAQMSYRRFTNMVSEERGVQGLKRKRSGE